eukprot:4923965-Ditylum_brightwellii.AAC.1
MALQIDKDIYKEEVREYMRERKVLERVTKQAYAQVWGQCSRPMHEKLKTMQGFDTVADEEDTVFKFDNKCDIYTAMGNIVNSDRGTWSKP